MVLRPEFELLLSLALCGVNGRALKRVGAILNGTVVDWQVFATEAVRSGLVPSVYPNLVKQCKPMIPVTVMELLQPVYRSNVIRCLQLSSELLRILKLFNTAGIPAFAYKGPMLGQMVYGDPCLRSYCDLDLFLNQENVRKAKDLLIDGGFKPEHEMTAAEEALYFLEACEYNFIHATRGVVVELHWKVALGYASFGITSDELWEHLESMNLLGEPVQTLSSEYALLVMAVHGGGKHHWERISWILDVAMLVESSRDLDWQMVVGRARKAGLMRALLLGLLTAQRLFDITLPAVIDNEIKTDASIWRLATGLIERYIGGSCVSESKLEHLQFSLQMRENLFRKISYLFSQITVSNHEERRGVPLPAMLRPLYGIIRLKKWATGRW